MNRYLYADGDPVNNIDPDGHLPKWLQRGWKATKKFAKKGYNIAIGEDIRTLKSPKSKWYHKAGAAASIASNFIPGAGAVKWGIKAVKYGKKMKKAKKFVAVSVKKTRKSKLQSKRYSQTWGYKPSGHRKSTPRKGTPRLTKPASGDNIGVNLRSKGTGNVSKGWKVGDDVYKPTSKGNEPAWNTVRSRFWKNEATSADAVEKYGAENVARMKKGNAPQRYNPDKGGMESMELSHEPIPKRDGGKDFVPRWPQDHAKVDPFRRPGY